MKDVADKLTELERRLSKEQGEFALFGLFEDDSGSPPSWDLLVSAPWIERDRPTAIRLISDGLKDVLAEDELLKLSRVLVIDKDDPSLGKLHKAMSVKHRVAKIENSNLFGLRIPSAFLITSSAEPFIEAAVVLDGDDSRNEEPR